MAYSGLEKSKFKETCFVLAFTHLSTQFQRNGEHDNG